MSEKELREASAEAINAKRPGNGAIPLDAHEICLIHAIADIREASSRVKRAVSGEATEEKK